MAIVTHGQCQYWLHSCMATLHGPWWRTKSSLNHSMCLTAIYTFHVKKSSITGRGYVHSSMTSSYNNTQRTAYHQVQGAWGSGWGTRCSIGWGTGWGAGWVRLKVGCSIEYSMGYSMRSTKLVFHEVQHVVQHGVLHGWSIQLSIQHGV